jgi:hypothetical protein
VDASTITNGDRLATEHDRVASTEVVYEFPQVKSVAS